MLGKGGKARWGGLSRNGGLPYIGVFSGDSSFYLDVVIFPLLTDMCYKMIAYETIDIVIVLIVLIVIIAVLIIHADNKNSAWYFYLFYNVDNNWEGERGSQPASMNYGLWR